LEEQGCGVGVEGDVADFIDDEQRDASEAFELVAEAAGVLGVGESGDPFGRGGERDPVAASRGLDASCDRQVGLAGAWGAQEDHVVGFSQEVELVEMRDLLPGDGALVGEVEIVEGLGLGETGSFDPVLAAVGLTRRYLFGEDPGQELGVVPTLVACRLGERRGDLSGSGHL
jgi:hypothetical protein